MKMTGARGAAKGNFITLYPADSSLKLIPVNLPGKFALAVYKIVVKL
jgi:hypothetical protein